jgi:hypothetical protein
MAMARKQARRRVDVDERLVEAADRRFRPDNPFGVVGYGVDTPRRRGEPSGEPTLVALVLRKEQRPTRRVPAIRVAGQTVTPDVIGVGRRARPSFGVGDVAFTGLHAGAAVYVRSTRQVASIGVVLTQAGRPAYLTTAGHAFAEDDLGAAVHAAPAPDAAPVAIGTLRCNLLDADSRREAGVPHAMDVALVALNPRGVALAQATRAPFEVSAFAALDRGRERARTRMWSWQRGDFVGVFQTHRHHYSVEMDGGAERDRYWVRRVYDTDRVISQDFDSGSLVIGRSGGPARRCGIRGRQRRRDLGPGAGLAGDLGIRDLRG